MDESTTYQKIVSTYELKGNFLFGDSDEEEL